MKLVNVMASSLDGRIAVSSIEGDEERQELGLSSEADQKHLRCQIEQCDGIIVGASSIRSNQECLSHLGLNGRYPTWFVLTRSEIPAHYKFWQQDHIKRVIISSNDIPIHNSQVEFYKTEEELDATQIYAYVEKIGMKQVLLFGGGIINSWFYESKLVDELVLSIAPVIIGKETAPYFVFPSLPGSVSLELLSSQAQENFVFLRYSIKN